MSLENIFVHWSETTPNGSALLAPDREPLTFAQLGIQHAAIRQTLRQHGLGRSARIALLAPNGPELASAFLSVASAATCAPLNPAYRAEELGFYLNDLEASALVIVNRLDSPARDVARSRGIPVLELVPQLDQPAGCFNLENTTGLPAIRDQTVNPDDIALILHTSGTTARPKQVPLSHANLCASIKHLQQSLALSPEDCGLNLMPLFHIHGLVGSLLAALGSGGSLVCPPDFVATEFFTWLRAFQPSWYTTVPTIHQAILAEACHEAWPRASTPLRFIRSSSASLPPTVMAEVEKVFGVPVIEAYGMTEATHQMASNPLPPRKRKSGSVGLPAGPEIAILSEAGEAMPQGILGEVAIRGPNVMTGYAANPTANAQAFTDDWFRTGDQGYLDPDGYLFLTGRFKEQINRGGEKIAPLEIDQALLTHPAVEQAVTFALPHPTLGEDVAAAVVLKPGTAVTTQELRSFLAPSLAPFKIPRQIVFTDKIPKGPTGKLQRIGLAKLLGLDATYANSGSDVDAPRTPLETTLVELWHEVLTVAKIGVHEDFFALGGDSLSAARLLNRLRERLLVGLSFQAFFDHLTVTKLAQLIEVAPRLDTADILPMQTHASEEIAAGPVTLSFAQTRLWFLDQLESDLIGHNRPTNIRLIGHLNVTALESALHTVVQRHATLRTSFGQVHGTPVQYVSDKVDVSIPIIDLRTLPEAQREEVALEHAITEGRRGFALEKAPIFRALLMQLGETEYFLSLVFHHIVFDGWSQSILYRELAAAYAAAQSGRPLELPTLSINYTEYAVWQSQRHHDMAIDEGLAYWKQQVGQNPPTLTMPLDYQRPAAQSYRGARRFLEIPDSLYQALQAFSRQEGVTLFTTCLAAYAVLLHRYTSQDDIVIGSPFAGRNHLHLEGLIGLFINTLPLRCDLSGDLTFTTFLRRTKEMVTGALLHQEVPMQRLVHDLLTYRDLSRAPLFQALFIFEHLPPSPRYFGDIEVRPVEIDFGKALVDISLELMETPEGFHGHFEYATDLFSKKTMTQLTGHFLSILHAIVETPQCKLSELPLATDTEILELRRLAQGQNLSDPPTVLFPLRVRQHAQIDPSRVAVRFKETSLTYRELDETATQLAHYLTNHGASAGSRVGICLERGPDMIVAVLGCFYAKCAYVPLNPELPHTRLSFMITDSQVATIITKRPIEETLGTNGLPTIFIDEVADIKTEKLLPDFGPDDPAYVIYTSGSTGQPKGVLITQGNIASAYEAWEKAYRLKSEVTVHLQTTSFSFDVWVGDMVRALGSGGCLVICPEEQLLEGTGLFHLMERERVDFADLNKGTIQALIRSCEATGKHLDFLRFLVVGGEAWYPDEFHHICDYVGGSTQVVNSYGVTEATVDNAYFIADSQEYTGYSRVPIGRPFAHSEMWILDAGLKPSGLGVPGDLYIGGPCVAKGYVNREELNNIRFLPHPYSNQVNARLYKTGDIARYRTDGNIEFLGRADNQVKVRGYRIELGEIEAVLSSHPHVQSVVVICREDMPGEKQVVAYLTTSSDLINVSSLRIYLEERLPRYMVPGAFVVLERLPLTPNGKVDTRALRAPEDSDRTQGTTYAEPRTSFEQTIAAIWQEVLGLEHVGIHDNFFEVGGHSLLATQVMSRVQKAFQSTLRLRTLFEAPTVAGLAKALDGTHLADGDSEQLATLLDDLENLSEEETQALLERENRDQNISDNSETN